MSEQLLGVIIGGIFGFVGVLLGIYANARLEAAKADRERLQQVQLKIIGQGIQQAQVLEFIKNQQKRNWPRFWLRSRPDLSHANLEGVDLRHQDLRDAIFYRANLRDADFELADLRGADFSKANLRNANLFGANLSHAQLIEANLDDANLRSSKLGSTSFSRSRLIRADLSNAKLGFGSSPSDLDSASLVKRRIGIKTPTVLLHTDFRWADLTDANIENINLEGAIFHGAIMPDGSKYKKSQK